MSTYLVTGASRGLGFHLTSQLASRPDVSLVIAATRSPPSPQLSALLASSFGKIISVLCDVSSHSSIAAAATSISTTLSDRGLDVLINNAGTSDTEWKNQQGLGASGDIMDMPSEGLADILATNTCGAHRMTQALLPALRKGTLKKVVNITSAMGSIGLAPYFRAAQQPAYKVSKAALNMLTVQYALDLEKEGFTVVALSPGWLQTDLSAAAFGCADAADLSPEVGAKACIEQIVAAGPEVSGQSLNIHVPGWEFRPGLNEYDGKAIAW